MLTVIIAPLALVSIILLIISGKMNRLVISLLGAIVVAISLTYFDNIDLSTTVGFIVGNNYSNLHTILFVFGMMIIIVICEDSGVFIYLAFKLIQKVKGKKSVILYVLCFITFLFSSVASNILCIFLMIPLTFTICKMLDINPIPYVIAEGMVVNLGGLLFVFSSIPNLLINISINWTFPQYFMDVGIFSLVLFVITLLYLKTYNKDRLDEPDPKRTEILLNYNAWMFVKNKKKFFKSLSMLLITLSLVIVLPIITSINLEIIALTGGILTIIFVMNKEFDKVWKKLDLELIFYLFCILFISEAIDYTGVLSSVSGFLNNVTGGNLLLAGIILLWMSGLLSSVIHNAPITKILIPVVNGMSTPQTQRVLFSSVSMGTILGENLSTMGDNLVLITMVREQGFKLEFSTFMKLGIIITLIQLTASTIFIIIKIKIEFVFIGIILLVLISIISFYHEKLMKYSKKVVLNLQKRNKKLKIDD